ncbi:TSUP family transporter [Campylobacter insulaenigrae]|uniref:TSUP family transporter n=1 Tax=Campylobacter insulaenigrae TaxID=260714 RepID=UPI0021536EB3|nr:TSUP family transporter [Campylobacter insulaenigrae]MCR6573804.1 TSUP family transporter [Campylobacter insulaenigrae]MCR6578122.1 TSUP family transporter [Campylobacter insulaenigrae]MCR6579763.1 TSUP family transporter [Campylobacter insulaenigrae]MCR6585869.1 TSUP family transporter [Campylobacter insulaenigrae]MCR6587951.1 TSUP family transporter [Campylobacter insulaenigrae]
MELELSYYIILFFIAAFAGCVDAIVGGGGLITIPALFACGIPAHLALATNKLQSTFGSFTAVLAYRKSMQIQRVILGILFTAIGAIIGTYSVLLIDQELVKIIVLICLILIFIYTIFKPDLGHIHNKAKMNITSFQIIFGLLLGFYDGFLGPGTGSFWIFACVIFLGFNMKNASINTKILNFTSNVVALVVFLYSYEILWKVGILMGIGQVIGAFIGSRLVLKTQGTFIKKLFLIMVALTIAKVAYDYLA